MNATKIKYIYATKDDLIPALKVFEDNVRIKYVEVTFSETPNAIIHNSFCEIPNLGISQYGEAVLETCYLIIDEKENIGYQSISQRDGTLKYSIDVIGNPNSISWRPGGENTKNKCLIRGEICANIENIEAKKLWKVFANNLSKEFSKLKGYYIGTHAMDLYKRGVRLTPSYKFSKDCDLVLPEK